MDFEQTTRISKIKKLLSIINLVRKYKPHLVNLIFLLDGISFLKITFQVAH